MNKELKPCPFCGEIVSLDYSELTNKKHWYITCDCCGMMYQAVGCQRKDTKTGWNTRPIEDALTARIAELKRVIEILEDHQREVKNILIDKNLHIDSLYEEGFKLQHRIAELELENKKLFIHNKAMFKKLMSLDSPNDTQTQTIVYGKEDSEVQDV